MVAPGAVPRVVVVGLGPADEDLLTGAAVAAIEQHPVRFVRTLRHPAAAHLASRFAFNSFDEVYETAEHMEDVYTTIVERLVAAAIEERSVLYAVPGSPVVAERTVELLVATEDIEVVLVPALSFVDLAWVRLGVDPVAVGARIVDGHRFDLEAAGSMGALLVAQCDRPEVLEAVKLAVGDAVDRSMEGDEAPEVVVLSGLGGPDEQVRHVVWHELDRVEPDHLTSLWIPPLRLGVAAEMARLAELVATLRQACPWDRAQTHGSLRPHLLEEAHEVLEALDVLNACAPDDPSVDDAYDHLEEELGDLLFQVLFHATLGAEAGRFTLADVAAGIHDKLVARHPHVFADTPETTAEELAGSWERAKKDEKNRDSVFDGIPVGLPALAYAAKVLRKSESVSATTGVTAPPPHEPTDPEVMVGMALLDIVDHARQQGIDPESALRRVARARAEAFRRIEADRQ